jgi:RNA polymerase sigma factor (sigma-70 family)
MPPRIPPEVAAQVARLFEEHSAAVYKAALRVIRDGSEANDLVQETFQHAALHWDALAHHPSQRGWLCQVAIYKAIDAIRSRSRRPRQSLASEDPTGDLPSAEQVALTRIQAQRCLDVIGKMPEMRSIVAYLRFHEEWTNQMIAEHLGISPNTVGKHVFDARADLKMALPEMTLTSGPAGETDADGEEAP